MGIFCFYNSDNLLSEIEIYEPNNLMINNRNYFGVDLFTAYDWLRQSHIFINQDIVLDEDNEEVRVGNVDFSIGVNKLCKTNYIYISLEKIQKIYFY